MPKHISVPKKLIPYLQEMYYELLTEHFIANQVPDRRSCCIEGHNIWVRETQNPDWYRKLIEKYPKSRGKSWSWKKKAKIKLIKKDSIIKRGDIERVLSRLILGKTSCSKYLTDLFLEAEKRYLSGRTPVTEAETFFFEAFRILLIDLKVIETINNTPVDLWEDIASYYKENKVFPEWLSGKKIPF